MAHILASMPSTWTRHLKEFHAAHPDLCLKRCMQLASASYRRSQPELEYAPKARHFKLEANVHLHQACAVTVDDEDNVYCFNRGNVPLIIFNNSGVPTNLDHWTGKGEFVHPHGITVDHQKKLWLVDAGAHTVTRCDRFGNREFMILPENELVRHDFDKFVGKKHTPAEPQSGKPFNMPTHVAVHRNKNIAFVCDGYANSRIHAFTKNGLHLYSWGESGTESMGEFNLPHDICIRYGTDGGHDLIVVADRENSRIQLFMLDGSSITPYGQWFVHRPCGIHLRDDRLYVCQLGPTTFPGVRGPRIGNCVTIHNVWDGVQLARLGTDYGKDDVGSFLDPHSIAVDSYGRIFTANVAEHFEKKKIRFTLKTFVKKQPRPRKEAERHVAR